MWIITSERCVVKRNRKKRREEKGETEHDALYVVLRYFFLEKMGRTGERCATDIMALSMEVAV